MAVRESADKSSGPAPLQEFQAAGFQHLGLDPLVRSPDHELHQVQHRAFGADHSLQLAGLCGLEPGRTLAGILQGGVLHRVGVGHVLGQLFADLAGRRIEGEPQNIGSLKGQFFQPLANGHHLALGIHFDLDHVRFASISMVSIPAASSAWTTRQIRPSRLRALPGAGRPP